MQVSASGGISMHVPGATLHTGGANYRGSKDIIQKTSPGYDDGLERGGRGRKGGG